MSTEVLVFYYFHFEGLTREEQSSSGCNQVWTFCSKLSQNIGLLGKLEEVQLTSHCSFQILLLAKMVAVELGSKNPKALEILLGKVWICYVWGNNTSELVCFFLLQCLHGALQGVPSLRDTDGGCHIRWGTEEFRRRRREKPGWSQPHQQGKRAENGECMKPGEGETICRRTWILNTLCFFPGAHLEMSEPSSLYSPSTLATIYPYSMQQSQRTAVLRWTVEST